MGKGRLEAFTDGVLAIVLTIMVLELKVPAGADFGTLCRMGPELFLYLLSFIVIGLYWSNHHHLFQAVDHVDGKVLWANLHLLFWLSLTPITTAWMGRDFGPAWPAVAYGLVLFASAIAYYLLTRSLLSHHGLCSVLAKALGDDVKGKVSIAVYALSIALAFLDARLSAAGYALVAGIWFMPDPRIEALLNASHEGHKHVLRGNDG